MISVDYLLSNPPSKKSDAERIDWLVRLVSWLRRPSSREESSIDKNRILSVRLKFLLSLLEKNPDWKKNFSASLSHFLTNLSVDSIFVSTGVSEHSSFLSELAYRIHERLLPRPPIDKDLSSFILTLFPDSNDAQLVEAIGENILEALFAVINLDQKIVIGLRNKISSACFTLSSQILERSLYLRRKMDVKNEVSYLTTEAQLQKGIHNLFQIQETISMKDLFALIVEAENFVDECELTFHKRGVQINLVYQIAIQRQLLNRLRTILSILFDRTDSHQDIQVFISQLITDVHSNHSLLDFFKMNFKLLTERIIQGNSSVGEHYVTTNWKDFRKMFFSALGGGGITSITVYLKFVFSSLKLAGFVKGVLESLNYSGSFLFLQFLGFTLATKQPSNTAPYLAAKFKTSIADSRRAMIDVLRTQFISMAGNLLLVFPICYFISFGSIYFGRSILPAEKALHIIESTDPLGPVFIFACFTGLLIFLSSLIAGWFENWTHLHQIAERFRKNPTFNRLLGEKYSLKISNLLESSSNVLAANISLGFILGLLPHFLNFLGIPLEVRHVTLSMGSFASALPVVLSQGIELNLLLRSFFAIFFVGFLNIGVSFLLALFLAAISSGLKKKLFWHLTLISLWYVLTHPWMLLVPQRDEGILPQKGL